MKKYYHRYHASEDGETTLCGRKAKGYEWDDISNFVIDIPPHLHMIRCKSCMKNLDVALAVLANAKT